MSDQNINTPENGNARAQEAAPKTRKEKILKWVKILIFLIIVIGLIVFVTVQSDLIIDWVTSFLELVEDSGFLGMLLFVLVYITGTVLFVPGLLLTLGAGFVYAEIYGVLLGITVAFFIVIIGATIGSILAMLLGRYVFRESLKEKVSKYPKFVAIEEAISQEGFKLTFLLRLSPLIPFNVFNYFMGITPVHFRDYALACLGMIPGTLAYVYFGSALGSISDAVSGDTGGGILEVIFLVVGSLFGIGAVIYVSIVAKRKINKILDKRDNVEESEIQAVNVNEG